MLSEIGRVRQTLYGFTYMWNIKITKQTTKPVSQKQRPKAWLS